VPEVQTTVALTDAVRLITGGNNDGSPKWLTIARNQDLLNCGAQQASVNNPDLFDTECSVMPAIAYLADHRAETLARVAQASEEFAPAHSTPERQFPLAGRSRAARSGRAAARARGRSRCASWTAGCRSTWPLSAPHPGAT
jgi:hypothetical protein